MLKKLTTYLETKFYHWQDAVQQRKLPIATDKLCSIEINPQFFTLAYAQTNKDKKNLILCNTYPYTKPDDLFNSIADIAKDHGLDQVNCTWVLQPDQYQVLVMDELPVAVGEFQAAIRWKIKDLIRYPIDDIVVESFPLPLKKMSTNQNMMIVVVSKQSELKKTSDQLQKAGLHLHKIDILELSLRNIATLFDVDDKNTALIYMQEKNSQLVITSKKQMHFVRRIELGYSFLEKIQDDEERNRKMDRIALEVQRSFDYYQSQWRQSIPQKIIFASGKAIDGDLTTHLTQRLSIPVTALDITSYFSNAKPFTLQEQGQYLSVIGEMFPVEGGGNATTN